MASTTTTEGRPGAYDAIVVGLGAMGSAATLALARRGARVLGLDRFAPPHARGSSHGESRITRLATGEGAAYVPLVRRSHALWRALEAETGEELLTVCGGALLCAPGARALHGRDDFLGEALDAAERHGIDVERPAPEELGRRHPALRPRGDEEVLFEPSAGFVRPERAIAAQLGRAAQLGAELGLDEPALEVAPQPGGGVRVRTARRICTAAKLVLATGPWITELVPELRGCTRTWQQNLYWFDLADPARYPEHRDAPVYIWRWGAVPTQHIYGFPMIDGPTGGMKVATEDFTEPCGPDDERHPITPEDVARMYAEQVQPRLPGLSPRCLRAVSCLYTETPDAHFVLDHAPGQPDVVVASACSGHGFKHSAGVGEVLAQLALDGRSEVDVTPFALARLLA